MSAPADDRPQTHAEYMASLPPAQAERIRVDARAAAAEAPPLGHAQAAELARILSAGGEALRQIRADQMRPAV